MDNGVRLNKYIRDSGFCSRRDADNYIESGDVLVNKKLATLTTMVKPGDQVHVKGELVEPEEQKIYIAFNKPSGITCTTDRNDPTNIIDYIRYPKRIFPIGRIDKDSEGLILLTNDGDIVNRILRVGNDHSKEYLVRVNRRITDSFIEDMSKGVKIHNTVTLPCEVKRLKGNSFSIVLTEGLNRQIRLMCEALGYEVVELKRLRVMDITTKGIEVGTYRELTKKEIENLLKATENSSKTEEASRQRGRKSKAQNKKNPSVRHAKNDEKYAPKKKSKSPIRSLNKKKKKSKKKK